MSLENVELDMDSIQGNLDSQAKMQKLCDKVKGIMNKDQYVGMLVSYDVEESGLIVTLMGDPNIDELDESNQVAAEVMKKVLSSITELMKALIDGDPENVLARSMMIDMMADAFNDSNDGEE